MRSGDAVADPKLARLPGPVRYRVTGALAAWDALRAATDRVASPTLTEMLRSHGILGLTRYFDRFTRDLLPHGADGRSADALAGVAQYSAVWLAFEVRQGIFYEPTPQLHRLLDAAYIAEDVPIGMLKLPTDTLCIIPEPTRWKQAGDIEAIAIFGNDIRREVFKAAPPSDPAVFAYAIDTDAWVKSGKLDASEVKAIKLPGVEVTRKWLGSSSPVAFNQGIATAIFQLATLRFAYKDFDGSDRFNYNETLLKLSGAVVSAIGNLAETISETVTKAPEHPLSAFLMKHWAWFNHDTAEVTAKVGRWSGAVAGVILSGYDLFKNAPEAWRNNEKGLSRLYAIGGVLGIYIAISPLLSAVPFIAAWMPPLWPILVISIAIGFVIVYFKSAAINDWVSRCKFSKTPGYQSMDEELSAFNSAMAG